MKKKILGLVIGAVLIASFCSMVSAFEVQHDTKKTIIQNIR